MAAKLPTSVKNIGNMAGLRVIQAKFDGTVSSNDIDNGDTWASAIDGIVAAFFAPTTSTAAVAVSNSSGTLTFAAGGDSNVGNVIILARG